MVKVKALALWQPWASWIAEGYKTVETRTWSTRYRGLLVICASLHGAHRNGKDRWVGPCQRPDGTWTTYPVGCAVALALLDHVTPMRPDHEAAALCGYEPGRYAWELKDVMPLEPFPVKGRQGLFYLHVPDSPVADFWERHRRRLVREEGC